MDLTARTTTSFPGGRTAGGLSYRAAGFGTKRGQAASGGDAEGREGSMGRWRRNPRAEHRRKAQLVGGGALRPGLGQKERAHNRWTDVK